MRKYDIEKAIQETGLLKVQEALENGLRKDQLYKELEEGHIEKVAHGIYSKKGEWVDEKKLLNIRCPDAVFSHEEALFYYGLIDREPQQRVITIYTGYNPSRLKKDGVKVYTVKKELLDTGKIIINNERNNTIPIYDLERTMCDLVRSRSSFEKDEFKNALQRYAKRQDKNLTHLMDYAKQFRIDRIMREYMEVLL